MNPFIIMYLIAGVIYLKMENDLLKHDFPDFSGLSTKDKVFCLLHQIIHYLRILVLWPSYALEDFLIWLYYISGEEE